MEGNTSRKKRGRRVAELRRGDRVRDAVYLVESSNFKQARNQTYFIQMTLRDRTGSIKALRWEATEELYRSFGVNDFLRVRGRVEEFQQQLQLIVDDLERIDPAQVDTRDFLPASRLSPESMLAELEELAATVGNPALRRLLETLLADPELRAGLLRCPAGKRLHHAYVGGLLEHILSLARLADLVARNYPRLNRDLLIAAAVVHDIGKVEELAYERAFDYTDRGQLVGHIGLGLMRITRLAQGIPDFPDDLLLQLQHLIVSHHGLPEHGALKPPMTAEAIVFHYLDNLDAKLAMLESLEEELGGAEHGEAAEGAGRWSEFKPHLGRKIFFPRQEGEEGA